MGSWAKKNGCSVVFCGDFMGLRHVFGAPVWFIRGRCFLLVGWGGLGIELRGSRGWDERGRPVWMAG